MNKMMKFVIFSLGLALTNSIKLGYTNPYSEEGEDLDDVMVSIKDFDNLDKKSSIPGSQDDV